MKAHHLRFTSNIEQQPLFGTEMEVARGKKPEKWDFSETAEGRGGRPGPRKLYGSRCSEMDSRPFLTLIKAQKAPIFLYKFEVYWLESLREVTC